MEESMTSRSIGMDAIFQYTGSGVQLFSGAIFYIIIVRLFSTSSVGAIALFLAIVGLFNVIFSFGLGTAAQHFTSYNLGIGNYASVKKTIYKIIFLGFILSIAGFLSLLTVSADLSLIFLHTARYTVLVRLLSIVLLGNILFGVLNGALLGLQSFRLSAIINIIIWVSYYFGSVAMVVFIRSLDTMVMGWTIGIFLGVMIELAVILRMIQNFHGMGSAPSGNVLVRYSFPVLLSGLIGYGSAYADRFVVAGLLSLSALGVYNFALLISSSIAFIAVPFNNILMPKFSELFGRGSRNEISEHVRASTLLLSSVYVPAALGIAALSPLIIDLFGGLNYGGGDLPLSIIMFFSALFISQNILVQAIASVRKTKLFIYSSAAALGCNVVFSVVLIPRFDLIGAAIGFSSVYAASFLVMYVFSLREKIVSFDISGLAKVWIAAVIMFLAVLAAEKFFEASTHLGIALLPVYIILGALVYIACARLFRLFSKENKDIVLSLFPENHPTLRKLISVFVLH